jgi:hypothetical protein
MSDLRENGKFVPKCWNPLPSKTIPAFAPCLCELCDLFKDFALLYIPRGDPGTITYQKFPAQGTIQERSEAALFEFKTWIAQHEKPKSILVRDREAKALQIRQERRKRELESYWANFCAIPDNQGEYQNKEHLGRGWLLDAKEGISLSSDGINDSFFRYIPKSEELAPDDICVSCRAPLSQTDDRDIEDTIQGLASDEFTVFGSAVKLPCNHKFHHRCCLAWFESGDGRPSCMICRRNFKVVFRNGFDDQVYQWIDEQNQLYQVDGFIFPHAKVQPLRFKFFHKKDEWSYTVKTDKSP